MGISFRLKKASSVSIKENYGTQCDSDLTGRSQYRSEAERQ